MDIKSKEGEGLNISIKVDKKNYKKLIEDIKKLGGKWNPRTRDGGSWILPIEKEDDIKNLDALIEAEKIKETIFSFEQDLWEY